MATIPWRVGNSNVGAVLRQLFMSQWPRAFAARFGSRFAAEIDRWLLWLPAALGLGIAGYFALPGEPLPWLAPLAIGLALLGALQLRARPAAVVASLLAAAAAIGFALADLRTMLVRAPVLVQGHGPAALEAVVLQIEVLPDGARLLLERPQITGLPAARTPERIRVRVRSLPEGLLPGESVRLTAILQPPSPPAAPGAFDFQRQAYFERIGATGFAVGRIERLPGGHGATGWIERARQAVFRRTVEALPGPTGAFAAALMMGDRSAIPRDIMDAMRDSGLAHLLAISGLNLGLIAGFTFFVLRGALALSPALALRYPIKKWAALAAIGASFAYLLISGSSVPAERAFLMTAVVCFAVVIDRSAISMRLVAWAAALLLILAPETLLGASFQLSFAAVIALIAAHEAWAARLQAWRAEGGLGRKLTAHLFGVFVTSLIATAATAPFVIYHFNRLALFGIVANLLAVPITAVWIMPWSLAAFLLLPFGLEAMALWPMGAGIDLVIVIARWVSGLPQAQLLLPALPSAGLAAVVFGGLWLCLWQRAWRLYGLVPILAGMLSVALARPPDLLISGDGRLLGARSETGGIMLSSQSSARFTGETWLRRAGVESAEPWPALGESGDGRLSCDRLGCVFRIAGLQVALVRDRAALVEDCAAAAVVVSLVSPGLRCRPQLLVGPRELARDGGYAFWFDAGGFRFETVRENRHARPWVTTNSPVAPGPPRRRERGS
jgi:competence protein ComEC